jgi:hypothetical protein
VKLLMLKNNAWRWIGDVVRNRGIFGALRYYTVASSELARDLSPQRRRSRYGDIDYDFDHAVDTTWANVPLRTRFRELLSGGQYQASEPELFHQILNALPVSPEGLTFIDLGSGKGRTLLMASDYPFQRIIGVEFLEELHEVAQKNVRHYRSERQKCFDFGVVCADARDFEFPAEPAVLYLFNPFPDYVLRAVLENLRSSLESAPREFYLIYHNLVHEDVFREQSWLQELHRTHQFAIYGAAR